MPSNTAAIPRISVTMVSFATDGAGADKLKVEQDRFITPSHKPIPPKIDTSLALTPKSMTVWYDDSESSSSSSEDEESEEDNEHEGDDKKNTRQQQVLRRRRREQQEPYRAMHLTPPPALSAVPGFDRRSPRLPHSSRNQSPLSPKVMINDNVTVPSNAPVPRSPFSPLRHSFTAFPSVDDFNDEQETHPEEEEEESPASGNVTGISPSSSTLPEDKKGLDKNRFEGLLRSSRERRAGMNMRIQTTGLSSPPPQQQRVTSPVHVTPVASSARKTMDLRKEITLKAHAAKHGTFAFLIHLFLVRRIYFV